MNIDVNLTYNTYLNSAKILVPGLQQTTKNITESIISPKK